MSQLLWRPVDAPQLDTRPLLAAGQSVDNSLGRFADILRARDEKLNQDATGKAAASLVNAQTPEELAAARAAIASGAFGSRADALQVAKASAQRQEQLLQMAGQQQQQAIGKENLADARDWSDNADTYGQIRDAIAAHNLDQAAQLEQQLRDAGGGRLLYKVTGDGTSLYDHNRTFQAGRDDASASQRIAQAGLDLRRQEAARRAKESGYGAQGYQLATQLAEKYRTTGKDAALSLIQDDKAFQNLPYAVQVMALKSFPGIHERLRAPTPEARAAASAEVQATYAATADAEAAMNRQLSKLNTPLVAALDQATDPKKKVKLTDLYTAAHANDSQFRNGATRDKVEQVRTAVQDKVGIPISNEMIMAAIDNQTTPTSGFGKWDSSYYPNLTKDVTALAEAYKHGNNANTEVERQQLRDAFARKKAYEEAKAAAAIARARARLAQQGGQAPSATPLQPAGGFTTSSGDYISGAKLTPAEMTELKQLDGKTDPVSKARVKQLVQKGY